MKKQIGCGSRGWLPAIRRRSESYGGHVRNRLSVAAGVALAAGMLVTAQRASADWIGATSGSGYVDGGNKDYLHTGNWSGGTINDRFTNHTANLYVYLDGDRTGAPYSKKNTTGTAGLYIETADSTPRTLYLNGTIWNVDRDLYLGASTSTKLIVDLNGANREFLNNNQASMYIYAKVTGSGRLTLRTTRGSMNLYNPNNDWTGGLTIGGAYARVDCRAANVIPSGLGKGSLHIDNVESVEELYLNGYSQTVNDLSSATANPEDRRIRTSGLPTLTVLSINNSTYSGIIQDGISLTKSGAAQLTLSGGASANTHSGVTTVNEGTLALQKTAGVNAIAAGLTIGNGTGTDTVKLLAANQIANTVDVTFSSGGTPTLDLNGNSESVDAIIAAGAEAVIDGTSGTPTLGVGANNHASATFAGVIKNTAGSLALTKSGSGVQILSNVNTYSGDTTVSGGKLQLGSSASIASTNIFVGAGATLQLDNNTSLPDAAKLDLNSTGIVNLNFDTGKEQVGTLWINGSQMPNGAYTAISNPANFSGSGILQVGPPQGTRILLR